MGSYFHVIERKVGGNLDAFRRELGRLRESGHFHRDRHERIMRIAKTVGFGHIVRQCLVDTGHRAGWRSMSSRAQESSSCSTRIRASSSPSSWRVRVRSRVITSLSVRMCRIG